MRKITVITGHYGSGKTNISVNLALEAARDNRRVTVVDLDIVNPYFRAADFSGIFREKNIKLVSPLYANTNLDIPAVNFDLERILYDDGLVIIDVGGDDAGAYALGRYSDELNALKSDLDMLYTVNCYRFMTQEPEDAVSLMCDIENASRMQHTAIINNSNLGAETTVADVEKSMPFAEKISNITGLPLKFTVCPMSAYGDAYGDADADAHGECGGFKLMDVFVKPIWEQNSSDSD